MLALQASGCDQARVVHKPRLLSDNGSSYVSGELAEWLGDKKMGHVRGAPYHPQTQGKIERWHQGRRLRSVWDLPTEPVKRSNGWGDDHPAMMPLTLPLRCIPPAVHRYHRPQGWCCARSLCRFRDHPVGGGQTRIGEVRGKIGRASQSRWLVRRRTPAKPRPNVQHFSTSVALARAVLGSGIARYH